MAPQPIYLDNNATTPLDPRVLQTMLPVFETHFGNPASSTHPFGWYADELVTIAREQTARLLRCENDEIVFTSGATESNNLVLFGVIAALRARDPGRKIHVVSAATEHKSILDVLAALGQRGVEVSVLPVDCDGSIPLERVVTALRPETALVSLMLANNEIGTIHPIAEFAKFVRKHGALMHCDAVQGVGRLAIDAGALGIDYLSLSAHKFYGPKGVGALYVGKRRGRAALEAQLFGGGHEGGFRSGTLNVPGIVGLGKAAELANAEGEADAKRLRELAQRFLKLLQEGAPDIILNGAADRLPGNLNVAFPQMESAPLIGRIQTKLAVSTSSACQSGSKTPSHVLSALGLSPQLQRSSIRFGFGRFTTDEEVARAAEIVLSALRK